MFGRQVVLDRLLLMGSDSGDLEITDQWNMYRYTTWLRVTNAIYINGDAQNSERGCGQEQAHGVIQTKHQVAKRVQLPSVDMPTRGIWRRTFPKVIPKHTRLAKMNSR